MCYIGQFISVQNNNMLLIQYYTALFETFRFEDTGNLLFTVKDCSIPVLILRFLSLS